MEMIVIKYLLKNADASNDITSLKLNTIYDTNIKHYLASVEISWNLAGSADAELQIFFSNRKYSDTLVNTINIDSLNDSKIVLLFPFAEYIRIKYLKNSITSGNINVALFYSPVFPDKMIGNVTEVVSY